MAKRSKSDKVCDVIEQWMRDAPTHPHIQYGRSFADDQGDYLADIHPTAYDTWDKDAMLSEWSNWIKPKLKAMLR